MKKCVVLLVLVLLLGCELFLPDAIIRIENWSGLDINIFIDDEYRGMLFAGFYYETWERPNREYKLYGESPGWFWGPSIIYLTEGGYTWRLL